MTNLFISPIIYTNHHHAPMSIEAVNTLISVFAILTFIWIVSIFVRLIQMGGSFKRAVEIDACDSVVFFTLHLFMIIMWGLVLLFIAGNYISKLIF
jgi:hypothetical protein